MTEIDRLVVSIGADLTGLRRDLATATQTLQQSVAGPMSAAAGDLDRVFQSTFARLAGTLVRTATTGKDSFKDMVSSILRDLQRLALQKFVFGPLNSLLGSAFSGLAGGRAGGGPVLPGKPFVVGERGPELFVPHAAGRVVAGKAAPVTQIHFHFPPGTDADSFRRSQGQISALVCRTVARGQRNL
jgi:phage-related minor tail protein